ncbi:transposase [Vogesella fluminis]|uniref:IS66-like element accessory protein TnpA n=1 Tax=Vogesella fluminis TaxID=1069161 RepID=UPI001675DFFB
MSTENIRVSGRKGRPNYPVAYKCQVAIAACEPDISVAKLAQAHGLNPNMVFKWRRQYRAGQLGKSRVETALMPVTITPEPAMPMATPTAPAMSYTDTMPVPASASSIEIELPSSTVRPKKQPVLTPRP